MIEFKAECGHTVRAKDADAGHLVRCSYCGQETTVPSNEDHDLDFLFQEIGSHREEGETARLRKRRRSRRPFGFRFRPGGWNPFSIILRMCYAALLICVVVIAVRLYLWPMVLESFEGQAPTAPVPEGEETGRPVREERRRPEKFGLMAAAHAKGLYVSSTPSGAAVFCVEESRAPSSGRIHAVSGVIHTRANGDRLTVSDGTYVVEVVLAWNDPNLTDPNLPYAQEYRKFRRAIEDAGFEERQRLFNEFFLPDEATEAFISSTDEQIYLVRQYRGVEVRGGESKGVRALFLPKIILPGRETFSIAELVAYYIPRRRMYAFDEAWVRNELDYFNVPEADRLFVIEALSRIGVIPYATPDSRTRLFAIGIDDGMFSMRVLDE